MTDLERLEQFAIEYVECKAEETKLKKKLETANTAIKELMSGLNLPEVELADGTRVCYSVVQNESLDEEKLLVLLKREAPETECIKTKEYIDMDILENELYHERFSEEVLSKMDTCRTTKEIPRLTIKKVKKGKNA